MEMEPPIEGIIAAVNLEVGEEVATIQAIADDNLEVGVTANDNENIVDDECSQELEFEHRDVEEPITDLNAFMDRWEAEAQANRVRHKIN